MTSPFSMNSDSIRIIWFWFYAEKKVTNVPIFENSFLWHSNLFSANPFGFSFCHSLQRFFFNLANYISENIFFLSISGDQHILVHLVCSCFNYNNFFFFFALKFPLLCNVSSLILQFEFLDFSFSVSLQRWFLFDIYFFFSLGCTTWYHILQKSFTTMTF